MQDVTQILSRMERGDPLAAEQLLPMVYDELRRVARLKLAREKPGQTLEATALVHEVWLRLAADAGGQWNSRSHFFAAAAEAMRRILVEAARRKLAAKRGGELVRVDLKHAEDALTVKAPPEELVAVNDALDALGTEDPQAAELVKLHYFSGFSLDETADLLGMSRATAYRLWTYARAWLRAAVRDRA